MNVSSIFSAGIAPESPERVQELLKNIIIMINYIPGVRSSIGWRGVFRIPYEDECWTFKTAGFDGVFGLNYNSAEESEGVLSSIFDLYYFPSSGEELIEKFSLNGALFAYRDNYKHLIREFPEHPEFYNYFSIGKLNVSYDPLSQSITVDIESKSEDIIISEDGIRINNRGTDEFLVSPGEPEQAIPSYMLSSAVFNLLVSSFSYQLGGVPSALILKFYNTEKRFFKDGVLRFEACKDDVTDNSLSALFSESASVIEKFSANGMISREINSVIWRKGMREIPANFSDFTFMKPEGITGSNSLNRALLGIETKPPLFIVSGFLGAGKTSFIKNFLEFQSQKYHFGAVIQNELGETGLDGKLITDECRVVEMDEGCVCCSLSGNLRRGINSIISEFVPDFIILETTGAANPMNLTTEIHELRDIVTFDSVTTMVDAVNIKNTLNDFAVCKDQLEAADIVIINKTDNLSIKQIKEVENLIVSVNRRAVITTAEFGRINPALLYDSELINGKGGYLNSDFIPVDNKTHADDKISGFTLSPVNITDRAGFIEKIENLPCNIFRIKGVLNFDDDEKSSLFQYVSGRYEISRHEVENPDSFLIFIGKEIDQEKLSGHFA